MMINSKNLDNLCANIPFSLSLSLHYRITYNDSFEYAINSCILKSSVTYANNGQLNFSINFVSIDLPLPSPPSPAFFSSFNYHYYCYHRHRTSFINNFPQRGTRQLSYFSLYICHYQSFPFDRIQ